MPENKAFLNTIELYVSKLDKKKDVTSKRVHIRHVLNVVPVSYP